MGPPCVTISIVRSFGSAGSNGFLGADEEVDEVEASALSDEVSVELVPLVYGVEGGNRSSQKSNIRFVNTSNCSMLAKTSGVRFA